MLFGFSPTRNRSDPTIDVILAFALRSYGISHNWKTLISVGGFVRIIINVLWFPFMTPCRAWRERGDKYKTSIPYSTLQGKLKNNQSAVVSINDTMQHGGKWGAR
jgi:hypothetical protein